ncbi:MAG: flagellar hook-associated protein 2 [Solirubrobacteraceae bacterium]|nr:flagellar hook-associated protein 2 [Solirubrobacteraceae bacterium]
MAISTQSVAGLSSGLDTNTIIDQLMAIERQPQDRLKAQLSVSDARKTVLSDIQTRLKNLQLAAQDLKSATLWVNKQTVDVNDPTKVAVALNGPSGTGSYALTVTQLARGAQKWYTYAQSTSNRTITYSNGDTTTITANSDIDAAAALINADTGAPVYASAVTDASSGSKYLVLSSRVTGATAGAFTATGTGGIITEDTTRRVSSRDSNYTINGGATKTSPNNVVTDAIPGVTLTFKTTIAATDAITVNVGAPAPDTTDVTAKMKAFVDQYNSTLDFVRSKLDEKKVVNPQTSADQAKGLLNGDTMLEGILSQLRNAMTATYAPGNPTTLDQMWEIGVSTGTSVGSGTLNQDSIEGKLVFDATKFAAGLASDSQSVRNLVSGTSGFGQALDTLLTPTLQVGGTMESRLSSEDATHKTISDQIAFMDVLLNQKQATLKSQFAAMETALQASQAQGQWLTGQLNALNSA